MSVSVYVPKHPPLAAVIAQGSAVVGSAASDWFGPADRSGEDFGRIVIDYEGAHYGQSNMVTFADKAVHAADRHTEHYPTVARSFVPADDVIEVGIFDGQKVIPNNDGAAALLRAWIGNDDPKELEVTR